MKKEKNLRGGSLKMKGDKLSTHINARPLISLATEQRLCMKAWGWQPLPKTYTPSVEGTMKVTAASTGSQLASLGCTAACAYPLLQLAAADSPSLVLQAKGEAVHLRQETECPHAMSWIALSD